MDTNETNKENVKMKKANKIVSIVLGLVILILVVFAVIKSGIFKSNGQKLVELLTEDQYAVELITNRVDKLSTDGEKKYNITLSNNFLSLLDSTFSLLGTDLVLDANTINKGNNFDISAKLNIGSIELQSLEMIKEKDTYAISVPNVFENYIAVDEDNAQEIAEKLGFISGDESEDSNLNDDTKKFLKKYGRILASSIDEYIKIEYETIEINWRKIYTKHYILNVGDKEFARIKLDLLEKLKDDDESIAFIVKFVKANTELSDSVKEAFTEERLKEDILSLYNETLDNIDNINSDANIIEVNVYESSGKAVKTILKIQTNDSIYEVKLDSISDEQNDYITLSLNILDMILNFEYKGSLNDDNYEGEISISTDGAITRMLTLNVEEVKDSVAKIRKIKDLNALVLNEASDEELKNLKTEIEINLGITEDVNPYSDYDVYSLREFRLDNPNERVKVLEASRDMYNKVNPGMTRAEVVSVIGEPDDSVGNELTEYASWYYENNENIYLISAILEEGIVDAVYNDIYSSMENNIQVSKELETEINDLCRTIERINTNMKRDEVISILGDKYVEVYKDRENCSSFKWYDKRENSIIIGFDDSGKIYYYDEVSKDK